MGIVTAFMIVLAYFFVWKKPKTAPASRGPTPEEIRAADLKAAYDAGIREGTKSLATPPAPPTPTKINPAMGEFLKGLGIDPPPDPQPDPSLDLAAKFEELDKMFPGIQVKALQVAAMLRNNGKAQPS